MQSHINPNGSAMELQIQNNSDEVESPCDIERPSTSTNRDKQQLLKIHKIQENKL